MSWLMWEMWKLSSVLFRWLICWVDFWIELSRMLMVMVRWLFSEVLLSLLLLVKLFRFDELVIGLRLILWNSDL